MKIDNIIEISNAFKSFGNTKILNGVDFSLSKSNTLVILGDNGAGKSTLIKCICGLESFDKYESFKIDNEEIPKKYNLNVSRNLGIECVFQERAIANDLSIWRNIFAKRHIKKFKFFIDKKQEIKISNEILKNFLELNGINAKEKALNLSGGEKQGLAIARAIHFKSKILILDEPTTALGVKESKKLYKFLEILKKDEISIIIITHDLKFAYEFGDEFVVLKDQKISKLNKPNSIEELYKGLI